MIWKEEKNIRVVGYVIWIWEDKGEENGERSYIREIVSERKEKKKYASVV